MTWKGEGTPWEGYSREIFGIGSVQNYNTNLQKIPDMVFNENPDPDPTLKDCVRARSIKIHTTNFLSQFL